MKPYGHGTELELVVLQDGETVPIEECDVEVKGVAFSAKDEDEDDEDDTYGYDTVPGVYAGSMVPGGNLPTDDDDVEPAITEHTPVDDDDDEKEPTHACPVCEYEEHIQTPYSRVDYWCLACDEIRKFNRISEDSDD